MKGKLYAVGVGPGDPELLTLKAIRVLKEADVVAVPKGREEGESMALGIIKKKIRLRGKKIIDLHFPMVKDLSREDLREQAETILSHLNKGQTVAFVTLGDPAIYSTFFHLYETLSGLDENIKAEIIPGVSSINAASARAGISLALAREKVAILPAIYRKDLKTLLKEFDTVVLMKAGSVLAELKEALKDMGLLENSILVSKAGFPDELIKPLSELNDEAPGYFSTLIIRTNSLRPRK